MILKTDEFQTAANKILLAAEVDQNAANLELNVSTEKSALYLNVTNKEYYVSVKFALASPEEFRAVVDASTFLNLISGISTETFELSVVGNAVVVKSGKSSYKIPMIFDNDKLMTLPVIHLNNVTVEMPISNDILMSILNVNSKELQKAKKLDVNELQKLYYIDETGCFTFTTGCCLNSFTLEKPVKLLLNERIVKLFKLFKENDVNFKFGYDQETDGVARPKAIFTTPDVYMAARINCDDVLLSKIKGPSTAAKGWINETYPNHLVISANELLAAISRLMMFTKNRAAKSNMAFVLGNVYVSAEEITIADGMENVEVVPVEGGSYANDAYEMRLNLSDLKLVLDSCKNEHITLNCGNHRSVVITRGPISNVIPEARAN